MGKSKPFEVRIQLVMGLVLERIFFFLLTAFRVGFPVNRYQLIDVIVHINLGGGEAGMSEQCFDGIKVGTTIREVGCEGVPKHVRAFVLLRGKQAQVFTDYVVNTFGQHGPPLIIKQ